MTGRRLPDRGRCANSAGMVTRGENLVLGLAVNGAHVGWVLVLPAAPVSGMLGYLLARRLAKQV